MRYFIAKEIVPRDIASVYFLVDIHDKTYYDEKRIFSVNQSGYEIFKIMMKLEAPFTVEEIFQQFQRLIVDYQDSMCSTIHDDISGFLQKLLEIGYVSEAKDEIYRLDQ